MAGRTEETMTTIDGSGRDAARTREESIEAAIERAIEATYNSTRRAAAVVLNLESLELLTDVPPVLAVLPWESYDLGGASTLIDLVDTSSHAALEALRTRANLTSLASTTVQIQRGQATQLTLLTFGPETEFGVGLFSATPTLKVAEAAPGTTIRTRLRCDNHGAIDSAEGDAGSYAVSNIDLGLWGENLVSSDDHPRFKQALTSVFDGEPYASVQVAGAAPGLHFDITVVPSADGVIVDFHDRSHQVSALETLKRSQTQFDQLSATLPVGVFVVESEGRVKFASERLRTMVGPEIVATELSWMESIHPDDQPMAAQVFADLPTTRHFNMELRAKQASGEYTWSRWAGSDVRDENGTLEYIVGFVEDISEWRELNSQIAYQAAFDDLTGLPNRMTIVDELRTRLETQMPPKMSGVLFIDLDGFKLINDTQGHSVGDIVLLEVAQRFRRALRPNDLIGRFGGDEFVVVASDISDHAEAEAIGRRLHDILSTPVLAEGRIITVNASIGIALSEHDSSSSEQLIGDADIAMYEAKDSGRNRTVVFDATLRSRASQRFDMTADLRHARRRRELRLDYQPIVDLKTGYIVGAEALVRWDHPAMGRISPSVFIPLAEETGLIDDVGEWVVEQACADLDRLRGNGLAADEFTININASAQQFSNVAVLATSTLASLDQYSLRPSNLRFELTESVPLSQIPDAANRIRQLTSYGFGLAIDDFGTGYSSFGYLTMLPFDVLKLDLSLTSQLEPGSAALAVVDSLIQLSSEMDFNIVAEGIQNDDQHELLSSAGVQLGQGYHLSRPVPLSSLIDLLRAEVN